MKHMCRRELGIAVNSGILIATLRKSKAGTDSSVSDNDVWRGWK